jgi:hypothetical protein
MIAAANDDGAGPRVQGIYCPKLRAVMLHFDGAVIKLAEGEAEAVHGAIGEALAARDHARAMVDGGREKS